MNLVYRLYASTLALLGKQNCRVRYQARMEFIEAPTFACHLARYLDDEQYGTFQEMAHGVCDKNEAAAPPALGFVGWIPVKAVSFI
jgi:hypothetical protein